MDLLLLRKALLITLSILLVLVLWRRFRRAVMLRELPVAQHAELLSLEVAYHPARLIAQVVLPSAQGLRLRVLDSEHRPLQEWPEQPMAAGKHLLERPLEAIPAGNYHLEVASATQRTLRRFSLKDV
jgi:hypothetical protein